MDVKAAADALNRNQYGEEGSDELFREMKESGLVAVFGASDDLMEFRGAIYDEIGSFDGGTAYFDANGLLQNECDNDDCPHFERLKKQAKTIEARWCPEGGDGVSWDYVTSIPHAIFDIVEDEEIYCRGIVFQLANATAQENLHSE